MRYVLALILVLNTLPGLAKLTDEKCKILIQQAQQETNLNDQTRIIGDAYVACYSDEPQYAHRLTEALEQSNQNILNNQQAQLNNIQNQQNYTNWLLLQQRLNQK